MTQKKKTPKAEEDESTLRLPIVYKRKCEINGLAPHKMLKENLDEAADEGKLDTVKLL